MIPEVCRHSQTKAAGIPIPGPGGFSLVAPMVHDRTGFSFGTAGPGNGPPMEFNFTQRLLIQSLAALTVLRWIMAGLHDISPAEAQLMEALKHPAVAGIDGGHLTAWCAGIGTVVFGDTALGLRFMAPLLAVGASWMLYRLARSLTGEKTAAWTVALFNLTPMVNLGAIQMRPETPGLFLLIGGMVAVWRGLRRASPWDWHWPLAGLLFGAGFLCWYGAVWGVIGTFLLLAGSRRWRGFLGRPGPWLLLADFALVLWPLIDWNQHHAWAGYFQWKERIFPPGGVLQAGAPLALTGQWLALVSPVMLGAMAWALWRSLQGWRHADAARFIAAFAVPPILAALVMSLTAGARASWLAPALPALCLALPWAWENHISHLPFKTHLQWLCVLPALILTPLTLDTDLLRHAGLPLGYERDRSRDWRGWRTTAKEAESIIQESLGQTPDGLFLLAENERLASVLNFHLPSSLPVLRPTVRHPMVQIPASPVPESDYHFWPGYSSTSGGRSAYHGRTALYFTTAARADVPDRLRARFREVAPLIIFDTMQRGLPLRRIKVFVCRDYLPPS